MSEPEPEIVIPFPPYKEDERELLVLLFRAVTEWKEAAPPVRAILDSLDKDGLLNRKRAVYILEKFIGWGFYECGVNVEMGWLTEKGRLTAARLLPFYLPQGGTDARE